MMKRFLTIAGPIFAIILVLVLIAPYAYAQTAPTAPHTVTGAALGAIGSLTSSTWTVDIIAFLLSGISVMVMTVMSWFLSFAGTLMNVGMFLTTHLGLFIDQTPAIYTVWGIIRDISSILLIFFILYAAIKMIVGLDGPGYGNLIKNIIIVGVLINFSFFFTRVLIDLSNIVSLELYNAVAPGNSASVDLTHVTKISDLVPKLMTSGGVSDVIMQSLKVTLWWGPNGPNASNISQGGPLSATVNILIKSIAGIVIIVITTISFAIAALAAIYRVAMLIFLLAFSPIWIAAMAMPQLSDISKRWTKHFKAQLIFFPVYFAFLYVALQIITATKLNDMVTMNSQTALGNVLNLAVGYTIMILLINIPFFAAVQISGGMEWTEKMFSGATGWMRKRFVPTPSSIWKNTGGRAASAIARNESFKDAASRSGIVGNLSRFAYKGTQSAASTYEQKLSKQVETRTKFADTLGYNQIDMNRAQTALRGAQQNLASAKANAQTTPQQLAMLEAAVSAGKGAVRQVEESRKLSYGQDLRTWGVFSAAPALWTKVTRQDKVGGARVLLPVHEKRLEQQDKSLKETQSDIKDLTKQLNNAPGGFAAATAQQTTQLRSLQALEATKIAAVNATSAQIDQLKLVK